MKVDKFMVQINAKTFEIILRIPNEKHQVAPKAKKIAKGSGKGANVVTENESNHPNDDQNAQRITALEAKFCAMEQRQDNLEGKMTASRASTTSYVKSSMPSNLVGRALKQA